MAASKGITNYIRKMMAKKTRILPRNRAAIQFFMQKTRISARYRAAMHTAYARMAADKSIVNHMQGMKIVKVANPDVEKGKAIIRLNPMQYLYFKRDMMNSLRISKEAVKISTAENVETGYKYLSNIAVVFGSSELAASIIRAGMLLYKTDKEFTEKELKTSLYGKEDEEAYAYLKEVHSSLRTVKDQLEMMIFARERQKMADPQVKKEEEDQGGKEVDGTEDKFKSAANASGNRNKNGKEDHSGNGKGNRKDESNGSGSGNGNGNGNGDSFESLLEKIKELF